MTASSVTTCTTPNTAQRATSTTIVSDEGHSGTAKAGITAAGAAGQKRHAGAGEHRDEARYG